MSQMPAFAKTACPPGSADRPSQSIRWRAGLRVLACCALAWPLCEPVVWAKEPAAAQPAATPATAQSEAALSALDVARLERLSWGATPDLIAEVRRVGYERWLAGQLRPPDAGHPPAALAALPAPVRERIDAMALSRVPLAERVATLETLRESIDKDGDDAKKKERQQQYRQQLGRQGREAASRSLLLALYSPNQLQEQMTWFWMNHFSVGAGKRDINAFIGDYENGIRAKSLGRFRDVLEASVFHPAMLRYLDNERNAAGRINENYARELLELHTLGVDGGYSQQDVQELAKVLTGLGIVNEGKPMRAGRQNAAVWRQGLVVFNPARNESGARTLLGQEVKAKGLDGVREVLDRLARHPATARYISVKLAQFYVADAPPDALVESLKARFLATDGDIAAVLQTLFASKEFEASLGRKFKDPQHFVVSAVRLAYTGAPPVINASPMLNWLQRLGQPPYGRQTPDGWPMTEAAWSSAGQMNVRFEVARTIGDPTHALFRIDEKLDDDKAMMMPKPVADRGGGTPPRVDNAAWRAAFTPRLSAATRDVLAEAEKGPVDEWNALALSSPEFMRR